jgi:signal transduction histidine kinase
MRKTGVMGAATATAAQQLDLLRGLADAQTPRAIAAEIVRMAQSDPACTAASVLWGFDGAREPECEPAGQPGPEEMALARRVATQKGPVFLAERGRIALRLTDTMPAVLLLEFDAQSDGHRFIDERAMWLETAGSHLLRALELAELRNSLKRLQRSERLQRALFAISDLAGSDLEMSEMLRGIQTIVGTLMYAENFFIVSYNAEHDTLRFLYFVDVEDDSAPVRDPRHEIPMKSREGSLTWYVIHDGKALMGNTAQLRAQISGPIVMIGPDSYDWLGVPMLRDGRVYGAIVVQSYQERIGYSADDRTLLEFVGSHILTALERKQGKEDLEQRVRLRTSELAAANQVLQLEIVERQRAERLQGALFQIAELATADISQDEFYHRVHAVVGELLNAQNFYIALVSDDRLSLEFPYYIDGDERTLESRPLGRGLSEHVVRRGKTLRAMTADIVALAQQGEILTQLAATQVVCWLGVPLFVGDEAIGLIVVQSYDPGTVYGFADQELLSFVASQVANSLHRRRSAESLHQAYAQLEHRVHERTQDLSQTLHQLRDTQDELVRQEKLASLGGLVAGIAHEINTPLGICITATTHVQSEMRDWRKWNEAGSFDATKIDVMLDDLGVALHILDNNIRRGAELVRSFKQVAVDRSSGQRRIFDLAEYLDEIMLSLKPKLKHAPCTVQVECRAGIEMDSFPGALSQVVTNLIMNALMHAFEGRTDGLIELQADVDGEDVILKISDDGSGMDTAHLKQFFDPFFTTKRGSGGTGLGAHVVFNQVTSVLGGTIRVTSKPGAGLQVQMRLPRTVGITTTAN